MTSVLLITCFLVFGSSANTKPLDPLHEDVNAVGALLTNDEEDTATFFREHLLNSPIEVDDDKMTRPVRKIESQGGPNGTEFDDFELLKYVVGVHSINISYTDQVNSLSVTYIMAGGLTFSGPLHGKISGQAVNIPLGPMEHITLVEGQTSGQYVNQLTFRTVAPDNKMVQYGPYGKEGSTKFSFENHVLAFHGRSNESLNSIGIYGLSPLNQSLQKGGSGGDVFNDDLPLRIPPIIGIQSISIWNGYILDGLQVEFITLGGSTFMGGKHGKGMSNNMNKITLGEGDHLVTVQGTVDTQSSLVLVTQLGFTVQKSNGQLVKYGPFGDERNEAFNFTGKIVGFHGSAGSQIDKIGVFFVNDN